MLNKSDIAEAARADFGLDHAGQELPLNNPIENRIRAIPPDTPHIELASKLDPIIKIMATIPNAEADALIHDCIKPHFELNDREIKKYEADLKKYRKEQKESPVKKPNNQGELIELLKKEKNRQEINPAQDFKHGQMIFAIKVDGNLFLITSEKETIFFDDAEMNGLILKHKEVDTTRFSPQGVIDFLNGNSNINIPELYDKIYGYITKYIFFKDKRQATYLTLWTMGTYLFKIFRYYPYVWLTAEKQSGKSLAMRIISRIAFNGDVTINPTQAVIFRDVAYNSISMFIDEVEQLRKQDKDAHSAIMSLLNVGFEDAGIVKRNEKGQDGNYHLREYSAYSPKMFAGINDIDDVLQDRTVRINMLRKKGGENTERYKESDLIRSTQREISDALYVFALTHGPEIAKIYFDKDSEIIGTGHLANRELDIWEPIFLLANLIDAGNDDNQLTNAMISLSKDLMKQRQEDNLAKNESYKLLEIARDMIEEYGNIPDNEGNLIFDQDRVYDHFCNTDEYSWLKDKTKNSLTYRLKKIKIKSEQIRIDGIKKRVYIVDKEDFDDLYERYFIQDSNTPEND